MIFAFLTCIFVVSFESESVHVSFSNNYLYWTPKCLSFYRLLMMLCKSWKVASQKLVKWLCLSCCLITIVFWRQSIVWYLIFRCLGDWKSAKNYLMVAFMTTCVSEMYCFCLLNKTILWNFWTVSLVAFVRISFPSGMLTASIKTNFVILTVLYLS